MPERTDIFKALGEENRLRLFQLLVQAGTELCCCELTDSLEEPLYAISRHLRVLKNAGLIGNRKEGRWTYSFLPRRAAQFQKHLQQAVLSLPPSSRTKKDLRNLARRLALRQEGKCVRGTGNSGRANRNRRRGKRV